VNRLNAVNRGFVKNRFASPSYRSGVRRSLGESGWNFPIFLEQ